MHAKDSVFYIQHLETPLHLAVFRGHVNTIKVLLKFSLEKDQQNIVRNIQRGQTALDLAKSLGNPEIISIIENWTVRSLTHRSATLNIVEL